MFTETKVTVQIICYNQENVIRRCLDSVFCQKDFVNKVLIFDDCSSDNTLAIIQEYEKRYPGFLCVLQADKNLGIFQNVERRWKYPTRGLVYDLSGDDEVPLGWFESVGLAIKSYSIDVNDAVALYGDYMVDYGNGKRRTFTNSHVSKGKDLWRLYQRGYITNRAVCYSSSVKLKYSSCLDGRSYVSENVQDSQLHLNVQRAFYLPKVGNVYHAGIGVSASMTGDKWNQHLNTMFYSFEWYKNEGYSLKAQDRFLPHRNRSWKQLLKHRSIKTMLVWSFYAFISMDASLGLNLNRFNLIWFKLRVLNRLERD